jgi:predicted permease
MEVRFDPVPDGTVLGVTAAIAALSTVAFGLGPALRLSRRDLVTDLKDLGEDRSVSRRFFTVRNLMVVGQVSLSLALLVAAGIFTKTAMGAAAANPGYAYEGLVLASLDPAMAGMPDTQGKATYRAVLARVRALPGVTSAGLASTVPFGDVQEGRRVERIGAGATTDPARARTFRIITAGHFESLGLTMVRGREFTTVEEASSEGPSVCIIDEVLARQVFGAEDPIGQFLRTRLEEGEAASPENEPMLVVGVAPPIREELLENVRESHVYVPFGRHYRSAMHLHARLAPGGDEAAAAVTIRQAVAGLDPRLPILAVTPMQSFHDRSLELWALQTGGRLFATLGVLALTLAVVGVYGVKAYMASQRRREIGIRMALGASRADVLGLLFRDGATLTVAGLAVGVPLSAAVSMAFAAVFVEVGGIDPVVIGLAAAVLAVSALAASAVPAWRAARMPPLTALRTE